jgi:hypothetical protein
MELCHFLRFKLRSGTYTTWAAQNFFPGEDKDLGGVLYPYRPVAVQTNGATLGGDRAEAAIASVANELTLNVFAQAADEDWLLEVKTVKLNRASFALQTVLTEQLWACTQVQYDSSNNGVVLQLASPLDSVQQRGGRLLSQSMVGALPTTGTLTLQ